MSEELTFEIEPGNEVRVRSYDELMGWLEKERAKWDWLERGSAADRHNIATEVQNSWDNVFSDVRNVRANQPDLPKSMVQLDPLRDSAILISSTQHGTIVEDIRSSGGEVAAAFAAGLLKKRLSMTNAQDRDDLLGAILSLFPDLSDAADWHERLKRERANYKSAARSLSERVERNADKQKQEVAGLVRRGSLIAKRMLNLKRDKWSTSQERWQKGATAAVEDIQSTEAAYLEYMKLKAPVEYWEGKGREHEEREKGARFWLYVYFPVTILLLTLVFGGVGWFLISHPDTQDSKAPVALYVVISGGLLLFSTISFWVGRILTKLFLSEHHLRNDAEERAVMTTTYLALTSENAASNEDRQIILNALFRPTPDGIVKDDGPTDASVQGLIARMAAR